MDEQIKSPLWKSLDGVLKIELQFVHFVHEGHSSQEGKNSCT